MHQRNRYQSWRNASREMNADHAPSEGYWGSIDIKPGEKAVVNGRADGQEAADMSEEKVKRERSDILGDNAAWLDELLGWQELRARKGETKLGDRENMLGESAHLAVSKFATQSIC